MGIEHTRPGKHTKSELENGPVEIVDLPIQHADFPWLCYAMLVYQRVVYRSEQGMQPSIVRIYSNHQTFGILTNESWNK
jgi:hypothetical protein